MLLACLLTYLLASLLVRLLVYLSVCLLLSYLIWILILFCPQNKRFHHSHAKLQEFHLFGVGFFCH